MDFLTHSLTHSLIFFYLYAVSRILHPQSTDERQSPYVSSVLKLREAADRANVAVDEVDCNAALWEIMVNSPNPEAVKLFYNTMLFSNILPNLYTFGLAVASCVRDLDIRMATLYLEEMARLKITPTAPFFEAFNFILKEGYPETNTTKLQSLFSALAEKANRGEEIKESDLSEPIFLLRLIFFKIRSSDI